MLRLAWSIKGGKLTFAAVANSRAKFREAAIQPNITL